MYVLLFFPVRRPDSTTHFPLGARPLPSIPFVTPVPCSLSLLLPDSGIPTKPVQLRQQDLFYAFKKDETAVLTCNVQSTPPPAYR